MFQSLFIAPLIACVVLILLGAFLWTTAEKFAGPVAEESAKVQSGDWVVRLAFGLLGVFLIINSVVHLASGAFAFLFKSTKFDFAQDAPYFVGDAIKFLLGLWLVLTNRFTRYGLAETQITSQSPSIPD